MANRRSWDQLPDESGKAYEAFAIYRDMGINRSLEAVAHQLNKSKTIMGRWSAAYNWIQRTYSYDRHIEAEAQKQVERDAIRRKAEMLKRHATAGRILQQEAAKYLTKKDGGIDRAGDAIQAMRIGVDMERKAEGLPEHLLQVIEATDDELQRQYNAVLAEIGLIGSGDETAGDTDPAASEGDPETTAADPSRSETE